MNETSILPLQTEALREDLIHIENTLNALKPDADASASALQRADQLALLNRVRPRFDYLIQTQRTALDKLESDIKNNLAPSDAWKRLREIRQECKSLFQACLALIEGALVRLHGLDGGLCRITDAMLDEMTLTADASWRRFTVWADGDSFANLDEVIRVRFPSINVWHLPVVAHEFGHFISQNLNVPGTQRRPFVELCANYKEKEEARFLPEYFSDIFATYAVGPAYVCACVMLRFDHGAASVAGKKHPSDAMRVYAQLHTLEKMDQDSTISYLPQYEYVRRQLGALWQQSTEAAFQRTALDENKSDELNEMFDSIYHIINSTLPPRVQYGGWLRAQQLSNVLRMSGTPDSRLKQLNKDDTIIDVVNAAWLARLTSERGQAGARELSESALALCNAIAHRRSA